MRNIVMAILLTLTPPAMAQTAPKAVKTLRVEAAPAPLYAIDADGSVRIDWSKTETAAREADLANGDIAKALIAARDSGVAIASTHPGAPQSGAPPSNSDPTACQSEAELRKIACRNLAAQESAANSASWQFYLSALGSLLLLGTLIFTGMAALEAIKANRLTRKSIIDFNWPILQFEIPNDEKKPADRPPFFRFENVGKSAAFLEDHYLIWLPLDGDEFPPPVNPGEVEALPIDGGIAIGPGAHGTLLKIHACPPKKDGQHLIGIGFVRYRSADGQLFIHGFCWQDFEDGSYRPAWPPRNPNPYNYHRSISGT